MLSQLIIVIRTAEMRLHASTFEHASRTVSRNLSEVKRNRVADARIRRRNNNHTMRDAVTV